MKMENLEQMFATLQPDSTEFISSLSSRIARNPKLKTKFSNSTEQLEKEITYYWNIVCENIGNISYLKLFVKSLASKYITSHLIVENWQIMGDIFTNALKTYLKDRYTPEVQQEIFCLFKIIIDSILEGAKEQYSLWDSHSHNVKSHINRLRIEAIIRKHLQEDDLNSDSETIKARLLQDVYFQEAMQKLGREKTLELIADVIQKVKE